MSNVFSYTQQLPKQYVGLVLGNQLVYFLGGAAVVEIAALHGQPLEEGAHEAQEDLRFRHFDETDGLAIGLQCTKSVLLVHLGVVVQGTKDDLVALRKLLYLVECPQLVAFFERIGNAGQEDENLHLIKFREQI